MAGAELPLDSFGKQVFQCGKSGRESQRKYLDFSLRAAVCRGKSCFCFHLGHFAFCPGKAACPHFWIPQPGPGSTCCLFAKLTDPSPSLLLLWVHHLLWTLSPIEQPSVTAPLWAPVS